MILFALLLGHSNLSLSSQMGMFNSSPWLCPIYDACATGPDHRADGLPTNWIGNYSSQRKTPSSRVALSTQA